MIDIDEQPSAPELPGAGTLNLYADSGGLVMQDAAGVTTDLTGQIYPEQLVLWGVMQSHILAFEQSTAIVIAQETAQRHRFTSYLNPSSPGELLAYYAPLKNGAYTMQLIGLEFNGSGVMVISVDDDNIATRSMYDSGVVYNEVYTVPFVIGQSGLHKIAISSLVSAANANENSYLILTKIIITKD